MPYNGNPALVQPVRGALRAVAALRDLGLSLGVISNQSGIARGLLTDAQVEAVNRRTDELLGPFDVWLYCPHGPDDGCDCRKPLPKMVVDAARALRVDPHECVVIGDRQSDVDAARAAGAQAVLFDSDADLWEATLAVRRGARGLEL